MRQKLASVVQQEYSAAGGVKSLAEILNQADRPTERNVLDSLTEADEELGEPRSGACCSSSRTSPSSTTARSS
jgi:flagellar motor switch protein FliG